MSNNRIFYAVQAASIMPCRVTNGVTNYGTQRLLRGIQSISIATNFNLEQIYQLGQLELYDSVEEVPDIEISLTKVLDGRRPLYLVANDGDAEDADNLTLTQISDRRCDLSLGIWPDTNIGTSGTAEYYVICTGLYVSNVTYNLVSDGNFTEDLTLVGNHKKWNANPGHGGISSAMTGFDDDETKRIAKRWALSSDTIIPKQVAGVATSGGATLSTLATSGVHINSITITCNLGRESINELSRRSPYYRYINFPVEVTAELEVTATQGDNVDADDFGSATGCSAAASGNLYNGTIKAVICDTNTTNQSAYIIDLGDKNKLTSVNYTGGDTGGGNATITYSYQTFNDFKVSGLPFVPPPPPVAAPNAISNLSITSSGASGGNGVMSVSWTAPNDNGSAITNYIIGYSEDNSTWNDNSSGSTSTSANIEDYVALTPGTTYYIRVFATNAGGNSSSSNVVSGVPLGVPDAPGGLYNYNNPCSYYSPYSFDVSWMEPNANGSSITSYLVESSEDGGNTWGTSSTEYGLTAGVGGTSGATVYVRVRATNSIGNSEPSDTVSGTIHIPGCTDSGATNYDSSATCNDGSCI